MKRPSVKEQEAVVKLGPNERVKHFVKAVTDFEEAWSLWADGWAVMADGGGTSALPLWPAEAYARAFAAGDWTTYEPRRIPLSELVNSLLPAIGAEGTKVAVFPTKAGQAVLLDATSVVEQLNHEYEKNYG